MTFQCSGTVCLNYVDTKDYIIELGDYKEHPFNEGEKLKVRNI